MHAGSPATLAWILTLTLAQIGGHQSGPLPGLWRVLLEIQVQDQDLAWLDVFIHLQLGIKSRAESSAPQRTTAESSHSSNHFYFLDGGLEDLTKADQPTPTLLQTLIQALLAPGFGLLVLVLTASQSWS